MIQSLLRPVAYFSMFPVFGVGALCFYVALRVRVLGVGKIEGERLARLFIHHGARLLFAVLRWFSLVDARVSVVPRSGLRNRSAVVVGNHPSVLDAMLFLSFVPNGVCVMKRALLRVPIIAGFSKLAGYIPYAEAPEMIHAARRTLRDGGSIIIFPEGTRSPEGRLGEFHRGAARIALEAGVPLEVIAVSMEPVVLGRACSWLRPPRKRVVYRAVRIETGQTEMDGPSSAEPEVVRAESIRLTKSLEVQLRNSLSCPGTFTLLGES